MDREFQIFIKPVGAACNLRCSYCYYLDRSSLYPETGRHLMSDDVLERYIIQHIEASTDKVIMFSWHGGEPTLAGLDFYRKAVALQKKHLPSSYKIINGIQTNGTLLDDDWCRFLSDQNFLVGISIDGPQEFHDKYRTVPDGKSVFGKVMKGYELLKKYNITSEILCVLNSYNSLYPDKIYVFFKGLVAEYLTFLPLVERIPGSEPHVSSASVNPPEYGKFLSVVFDEWVAKDIGKVRIQLFEESARTALRKQHALCVLKVTCGGVPVIEQNGDFYSCDHFVDSGNLVGNINITPLADLLDSPVQKSFGEAKRATLPRYCRECEVLEMCNGECPKNRFILTPDGESGLNYLCPGYKLFFNHCRPFIEALRLAQHNQQPATSN
ncbi:MAG: anaerobic sulfatase maturase [Bacteroidota bacterium]